MKKSIFSASFEESLNLLDDASLQYIKKDYYEKLGKGLNNGKPSIGFRIKSILYSILFVFGCNFLLAIFASSLDVAEPKDLTLPVHKPSLLTPELFLICCFIWLSLVLIGNLCENHSSTIQISLSYRDLFYFGSVLNSISWP